MPVTAQAETLRIATYNASLTRNGAGLMLAAIERGQDERLARVAAIIQTVRPDILLINELDHDPEGRALAALQTYLTTGRMGAEGITYAHVLTAPVNTGVLTGQDLDGDGHAFGPRDAQGFGRFPGQYGMAILSRYDISGFRSFQEVLWSDLPGAIPPEGVFAGQRLSSKSHWDVEVRVAGRPLHLLASHPTPPVFDGPEDFNGRRNHDETMFWVQYLSGQAFRDDQGQTTPAPTAPVLLLGDLNADPFDGDARRDALSALLSHPRLQDPTPMSDGAVAAARAQVGANAGHQGDPAQDTADWNDDRGPGNLRVDYVLPDARLTVLGSGVFWPAPGQPGADLLGEGRDQASDHRLVWVDIDWPG
ncbi:endonuclease/exonuclease/phosphatase family metal-dependent hydrolase [Rubricella aquisinus]|uniref:Endonuclease/exonuclease/phosphatase family metal-dependent hydrolase n=1 Tax=Rubricella aquisinus TaxID=2028108 RepID=A0A840X0R7_9RHOB|nr:endonuclease/exonuclease/phosphatase family protein [Rubricella aquisinus]MBB5514257.1 endonuclease/exonuclease/phosphatase family metal-dependent hydrolase [Rubricella aquisinus]